ncbi:MAG TPA: amino acid permease [Ruminiclostridium sp.]|nr:amino acid permease [Ruminiclostridium sp.]
MKIETKKKEKGLNANQLAMMAVETVVGGSFFLGSSVAIKAAGLSILISYILGGALVYFILMALSEMTVANTSYGSFRVFASEAFGKGTGFVVGWVYWFGLVLGMSSEATAVSILIRTWLPQIPISIMGSIIIIGITLLNLLGAEKLSRLESGLASIKIVAILLFIVIGAMLIFGLFFNRSALGFRQIMKEPFMPGGIGGLAGSMLIVMFAYSGFETIGLAASEARNPLKTIPKAIRLTVTVLVLLYVLSAAVLFELVPTSTVNENVSPFVAALNRHGFGWAGTVLNIVLVTAILSTMLASVFGLGRVFRSLADDGFAPSLLKDKKEVPFRGILFSGAAMLAGLGLGLLFPSVYLFLLSSGGFAMLFTYAVIMASHIRLRRKRGCPPDGKCQMPGFPITSMITLIALVISIVCMPFVPGQDFGLIAGIIMVIFFMAVYAGVKLYRTYKERSRLRVKHNYHERYRRIYRTKAGFSAESSKELNDMDNKKEKGP